MPSYGGQAVIEGVMMRGTGAVAIAMRAPDQQLVVHTETLSGIYKSRIARIPFLRGMVVLWDALGLGMRALTISANVQTDEDQKRWPGLPDAGRLVAGGHRCLPARRRWGSSPTPWDQPGGASGRGSAPDDAHPYIWAVGLPDVRRNPTVAPTPVINAFEGRRRADLVVATYPLEHYVAASFILTWYCSRCWSSALGPIPMFWRLASRIVPTRAGAWRMNIRWTANHLSR
jgi:hypothetical protein